jgi:hypothetical protein
MSQRVSKLILYLLTLSFLFINTCSSDITLIYRDIRYIHSRIHSVSKTSIGLLDGTKWGFGLFSNNTPGDEVIITYYESRLDGTAYINGIEQSVSFLGTTYDNSKNINDILKFNEGRLTYISQIDSNGTIITLADSTNWIVRPDQRVEVKKWDNNERVILDKGKQFIINPRLYQMANVQRAKIK